MTLHEAVLVLQHHQLVLHGKMIGKPDSKKVREAMEIAINLLSKIDELNIIKED